MSPLLRCGLVAAGVVGAFAAGFFVKPVPAPLTAAATTPPATRVAAKPQPVDPVPDVQLPPIHDPEVKPATVLGAPQATRSEPDPLDAAGMAMVRKEMGIKTTVLEKEEPVPAVLADARKDPGPPPMIPKIEVAVPPPPSVDTAVPMGGPMPRLEPPPVPEVPTIRLPAADPPPPPAVRRPGDVEPPTLINTRAVALDFEVTKTGPSKVVAVELWTTRNGGGTWERTDRMAGCVPPFRTRLGSDGVYGFRLVFENEAGMRTPEPHSGATPDIRVKLDTTPPRITDLSLSPVDGKPDRVRVRWTMTDDDLDHQAARIEYSTDGRTWLIARTDPNVPHDSKIGTSRVWVVPPGLPHRVMVRVTARDRAGNESTAELPRPVSIDLVPPQGKLTSVHKADPADVGPMPREVEAATEPARPVPEAIRSLLPALLASPSVFPPLATELAAHRLPCGVTEDEGPPVRCAGCIVESRAPLSEPTRTAREWVGHLTDTTVVPEAPLPTYRSPDPFAVPQLGEELTRIPMESHGCQGWTPRVPDVEVRERLWLIPSFEYPSRERLRTFREAAGYTGGRSLIHHLADPDWKPSAATPDSCRWEYDPAPTEFWGVPPLGIQFRF